MSNEDETMNACFDMRIWLRSCEEDIMEPVEGKVTGKIPSWLKGTLLRNGPGSIKVGESVYEHVFDGAALLHRFAIKDGCATYQCRFLSSETRKRNRAANRIVVTEFGTKCVPDPCHTIFDRIASVFNPQKILTDNAGVSIYPFGDQVYAMTEVPNVFKIDHQTLETVEKKCLFNSLVVCHTAHPHVMDNGDIYNVGLRVMKGLLKHVVVKFPYKEKGDMFESAEIVAVVEPRWRLNPSYMHSFGLTENYFIIVEQPLTISVLGLLRNHVINSPFASTLSWFPEEKTQIITIHRETGEQKRFSTDTFFFMHIINCFEKDGKLTVDLCCYNDAKIIDTMYVDAIKNMSSNPDYGQWTSSRPKRLEVPLDSLSDEIQVHLLADVGVEAPRLNYELYNSRPYRYFYGLGNEVNTKYAGSIIKVDTKTGDFKTWRQIYANPSEPIFVANPNGKEEDDGVLLTALVWGTDEYKVSLLILDARDLTEIARTDFVTPSPAPRCFHGWFLPDQNANTASV